MLFARSIVLFLLLMAGCQVAPKEMPSALRIGLSQDPTTLDPRKSSDFASSTLISLLFEGLMRCKGGVELKPGLAQHVALSKDEKTYLFTLRKTCWSDGRPVTAFDFETSWKKILTPGFPSPCAYLLYPIKNGEAYAKGLCSSEEVGIRAISEYVLEVELERATPYFLSLTAFPLFLPTPAHLDSWETCWMQQKGPPLVCNGPFRIETMRPGSEIVLKKNEQFWDASHILLDQISIHIVTSEHTAIALFEKGELDLVGGSLTPIGIDSLLQFHDTDSLHFLPMAASTFCAFNQERSPFCNESIRKAFAFSAKDHPMLQQEIEMMGQIWALHTLPPSLSSLHTAKTHEKALDLLSQGMQELQISSQDLETLTLYYKGGPLEKKVAQMLQRIWKESLGILIQIEQVDAKSLSQKLYAKNYHLSLTSWIAQFHDPINILERFREEKNPKNYTGWSSVPFQELLNKSYSATTPQERAGLLESAENLLEEGAPLIPLYHWRSPLLIHPRLKGLATTSSGGLLIEQSFIVHESSSPHR